MEECARVLRESEIDGEGLRYDGEVLTSEPLRARVREVCARLGAPAPDDIIVAPMRPGDAVGHEAGSGPLPAHAPICLDLWPQDEASGCWADMTRTWVRGDISDAVADLHRLVLEAHEHSLAATRPGVRGVEVYGAACDVFEAAGYPTQRTKKPGESLQHGFFFGLGHGVGLEVHEAPALGRTGRAPLIAGDVVAVEPGVVDPEHGGMRVEDLVLVTADGYELLTERSYDLVPVVTEPRALGRRPEARRAARRAGRRRAFARCSTASRRRSASCGPSATSRADRRLRLRLRQPVDHAQFRLPRSMRDRYTLLEALPQMRDSRAFDAYVRVCDTGEPWVEEITYDTPFGDGYMLRHVPAAHGQARRRR